MDPDRARALLADERARIEDELSVLQRGGSLESDDRLEPGDRDSEDLYLDEFNQGRLEDLKRARAATAKLGQQAIGVAGGELELARDSFAHCTLRQQRIEERAALRRGEGLLGDRQRERDAAVQEDRRGGRCGRRSV